jgi:phosphatidylglycerophosphate synthase
MKAAWAHAISIIRILTAPCIVVSALAGSWTVVLILFAGAALTDIVDGPVARALGIRGKTGMFLDLAADFTVIETTFVLLALARVFGPLPVVAAALSFGIFSATLLAAGKKPEADQRGGTRWGKYAGAVCYAGILLVLTVKVFFAATSPQPVVLSAITAQIVIGAYLALSTVETIVRFVRRNVKR